MKKEFRIIEEKNETTGKSVYHVQEAGWFLWLKYWNRRDRTLWFGNGASIVGPCESMDEARQLIDKLNAEPPAYTYNIINC